MPLIGTIIFLVDGSRLRVSRVCYVLEDFLEEEYKSLSYRELQEVGRIWLDKKRLERSFLVEKIRIYSLPFIEEEL